MMNATFGVCPACRKLTHTVYQYDQPRVPNRNKPKVIGKHKSDAKTSVYGTCVGTGEFPR